MFKKEIEYQDFNGQQRKEMFYFNLSKAELMEMELSTQAGMEEMIKMLIATKDNAKIVQTFKDLILRSYGIKSEDGTRFIKTPELREAFEQSNAYSELFMEILSSSEAQVAFINGVINGVNVPEMKEEDAIAKLKELGYDTSRIEESLKASNKVVPMETETKTDPNA
jgi:hypothetical protein